MDGSNDPSKFDSRVTFVHENSHHVDKQLGRTTSQGGAQHLSDYHRFRVISSLDGKELKSTTKKWYKANSGEGKPNIHGWGFSSERNDRRLVSINKKIGELSVKDRVSSEAARKSFVIKAETFLNKDKGIHGSLFRSKDFDFVNDIDKLFLYNSNLDNDKSYFLDILKGTKGGVTKTSRLEGIVSDLVGATTKGDMGYGHSIKYYKEIGSREVFAQSVVLINEGGIYEKIAKHLVPDTMVEVGKILNDTLVMVQKYRDSVIK